MADEFIIPAKDEKGHDVRQQFRCTPELADQISEIVASKKYPFRFNGDLMRYGAYLACMELTALNREIPSLMGRIDAANNLIRRRVSAATMADHVKTLHDAVQELWGRSAWGEIVSIIQEERRAAEDTRNYEPYWGQRWLDDVNAQFKHIEEAASSKLPSARLTGSSKVEDTHQ